MPFDMQQYAQPFTAPMVIPEIKYLCTKGYRKIIGPVATTAVAIFNVLLGRSVIVIAAPAMELLSCAAVLIMLYR